MGIKKKEYNDNKRPSEPENFKEEAKKREETTPNNETDTKYVKKFENKNKVKAWANPEESAEIIKKPKEAKPAEVENLTKGTNFGKKNHQKN